MKKTSLLILILFIIPVATVGAPKQSTPSTNDSFEIQINKFRYSLYKDIKNFDYDALSKILSLTDEKNPLNGKCKKFYDSHQGEIRNYRINILKKYQSTSLDLSNIKIDENFTDYTHQYSLFFNNNGKSKDASREIMKRIGILDKSYLVKIFFINPLSQAQIIKTFMLARILAAKDLGAKSLKNNLAMPLIKTEQTDMHTWKIIIDEYEHVYFFSYRFDTGKMIIEKVFKR